MFMHTSLKKLNLIQDKVYEITKKKQLKTNANIVVVSKTFSLDKITPLLDCGHLHFGENKVQEAEIKWSSIKKKYQNIQLHMVGKLQTNKAKKAVHLFDYIHSLDSIKLATKIAQFEKELNKKTKLFIQINVAEEKQKSGILINELDNFYKYCIKELSLNIIGLMCLPPFDTDSQKYFKILKESAEKLKLKDLSMGMSSDFEQAIACGSTYLRIGTLILGKRKSPN
tara:strand:- start:1601 stop:2278 length:678 start_codon:yes stop_codon:yes gene_type:complete